MNEVSFSRFPFSYLVLIKKEQYSLFLHVQFPIHIQFCYVKNIGSKNMTAGDIVGCKIMYKKLGLDGGTYVFLDTVTK